MRMKRRGRIVRVCLVANRSTRDEPDEWIEVVRDLETTEGIGLGLPTVALPYLNAAQAKHPVLSRSVAFLRECGVTVLLDDGNAPAGSFRPRTPKHGNVDACPWGLGLSAFASREGER
jgi:hypothetical protein